MLEDVPVIVTQRKMTGSVVVNVCVCVCVCVSWHRKLSNKYCSAAHPLHSVSLSLPKKERERRRAGGNGEGRVQGEGGGESTRVHLSVF